ncbi:hypothetical protein BFC21_25275 [Pseudomonas sp. TMW 2.1634]|nr:hypothetical protein BFC21_25275 [Pseudomonas sp. TMW 2.1634]
MAGLTFLAQTQGLTHYVSKEIQWLQPSAVAGLFGANLTIDLYQVSTSWFEELTANAWSKSFSMQMRRKSA